MKKAEAFPGVEEILSALIGFPTINGDELPAAQHIAGWLESLGMTVMVQDLGNNRGNVFATIGQGETLLFTGHLDVVPAQGAWQSNPFEMISKGERYYGRGCADMKGGIAAMISAAARLIAEKPNFNKKIALLFVADEEQNNQGTNHFIETAEAEITGCVIGEPTEMEIAVAHKGVARHRIEIKGRSAHASLPNEGINALEGAAAVIAALQKEHRRIAEEVHPILPPQSLQVTLLRGGEQENIIPGEAVMMTDHRLFPYMTWDMAAKQIEKVVEEVGKTHRSFRFSVHRHCFLPGGEISPEHPWAARCLELAEKHHGRAMRPTEFRAGCEMSLFVNAGIPTVVCGPGNISQAHIIDEWILKSQLTEAEAFYLELMRDFLA